MNPGRYNQISNGRNKNRHHTPETDNVIKRTNGVLPIGSVFPDESITVRRKDNAATDLFQFKPLF
jgi:hypothetical protein